MQRNWIECLRRWRLRIGALLVTTCIVTPAAAREMPVRTIIADFEDASVAARVSGVQNIARGDVRVSRTGVPARGLAALAIELGATRADVAVTCDLTLREPVRFDEVDEVALYCWINGGTVDLAFRLRDADERIFETPWQTIRNARRWVHVTSPVDPQQLRRVEGAGALRYPIQIAGIRLHSDQLGKHTIGIDDIHVGHRVPPRAMVRGHFNFDEPTRVYDPGSNIAASVVLENRSRSAALEIEVELAWMQLDGSELTRQRARLRLPASGEDFRSHRTFDFSQRIREPGLYRLRARARAPGWREPNEFAATIAVTPSNRRLSRGRETFFGVRSNLLREPVLDQLLEVRAARDIGASLLAIDVPWPLVEPKRGEIDFALLDPVIEALTEYNIACLLVIVDAPDWAPATPTERATILRATLAHLRSHYGGRLHGFMVTAAPLGTDDLQTQLTLIGPLREAVADAVVLPPAIDVTRGRPEFDVAGYAATNPEAPLVFATTGPGGPALEHLERFREATGITWRPSHVWAHRAASNAKTGTDRDAEAVLRHAVATAAAGVGHLLWSDLRDDDNDPTHTDALRGLLRRDFSPKTMMLGYATAAGQLTGTRYAGPVASTPPAYTSALFIGADRHIAVLLPQPNRRLPAVLQPAPGVPGEVIVQDFERRVRPALKSPAPTLVPTIHQPLFITLRTRSAEPEPQLRLERPWLRAPHTVFIAEDRPLAIEVQAPLPLTRSYLQLIVPRDAEIETDFSAAALRLQKAETAAFEALLKPKPGSRPAAVEVSLRAHVEGRPIEIPLDAQPLVATPAGSAADFADGPVLTLQPPAGQRATAEVAVATAYTPAALHIAVRVKDDRFVSGALASPVATGGDRLRLGVLRMDQPPSAIVDIDPAAANPTCVPVQLVGEHDLDRWRCDVDTAHTGERIFRIAVPRASLGGDVLRAGDLVRLAVSYRDDDADGFPPVSLDWGGDLDSSLRTADFGWLELAPRAP
jgi:hypothetical protein